MRFALDPGRTLGLEALEGRRMLSAVVGLNTADELLVFDSTAPGLVLSRTPISGNGNDPILSIDYRAGTGELYGISANRWLYVIEPATGVATRVGTGGLFFSRNVGEQDSLTLDPAADVARDLISTRHDLRIDPDDGTLIAQDPLPSYAAGDVNAGPNPVIVGAASTDNVPGAGASTLYVIDGDRDALATMADPSGTGTLETVGGLGVDFGMLTGFDVRTGGKGDVAYATTVVPGDARATLYTVDLSSGRVRGAGAIGSGRRPVMDVALPPQAGGRTVVALNTNDELLTFDSDVPGMILSRVAVSGLVAGERLVNVDFRPATGQLYGMSDAGRLYTIEPVTGEASAVSAGTVALSGGAFGFDFDPSLDRVRVTSDAGENLLLDPATGAVAAVGRSLAFAAGDLNAGGIPNVFASAYTAAGTVSPTLFDLDASLDALLVQEPADAGTLTTRGFLGVDATGVGGLDVYRQRRSSVVLAALNVAGASRTGLYVINQATGAARAVGAIAGGRVLIRDIAAVVAER